MTHAEAAAAFLDALAERPAAYVRARAKDGRPSPVWQGWSIIYRDHVWYMRRQDGGPDEFGFVSEQVIERRRKLRLAR